MASLAPVRKKIEWAKAHLNTLNTEELRYTDSDLCELVIESDPYTRRQVQRLRIKIPIPEHIPLIIGDCVHSLRCSLDYLVWELVLAAGNQPQECNQFPICSTREAFDNSTIRRGKRGERSSLLGVSPEAFAEIESLQPYNTCKGIEEQHCFTVLQQLSNIDKHRRIPLTVARVGGWNTVVDASGTEIHGFATPRDDGAEAILSVPGAVSGQKVQVQSAIAVFIAFDERIASDADVRVVLRAIGASIEDVALPRFERFFT
jgi:hypothetical protein